MPALKSTIFITPLTTKECGEFCYLPTSFFGVFWKLKRSRIIPVPLFKEYILYSSPDVKIQLILVFKSVPVHSILNLSKTRPLRFSGRFVDPSLHTGSTQDKCGWDFTELWHNNSNENPNELCCYPAQLPDLSISYEALLCLANMPYDFAGK